MKGKAFGAYSGTLLLLLLLILPGERCPLPLTEAKGSPTRQEACDVPLLHKGDFWNYTAEASEETLGADLSGYANTTVIGFLAPPRGSPLYILSSSSHLEGEFTYLIFRIHVTINIYSTSYISAEDLATFNTSTAVIVELDPDPLSLSGTYYYNVTFSPPAEELDFPLSAGKIWNISSAVMEDGSSGYYNSSYLVRGMGNITVPAGTFLCWEIYSPSQGTSAYYSPEVRGYVRRHLSAEFDSHSISSDLTLREFYVADDPPIVATPASPYHTLPSRELTVRFLNLSGEVHFSLWGKKGTFFGGTLNITSPPGPDNSPSNVDYGSFGLLLFGPSEGPLWVGSVVTHNPNLVAVNVTPTKVKVLQDESVEVVSALINPSTEPLQGNYTFTLDSIPFMNGSIFLAPGESRNISVTLPPLAPGEHHLIFIVDPEDLIEETVEEDNSVEFVIAVLERVEITLLNRSPSEDEVWIQEGEEVLFTVQLLCEDEVNLTSEWFLSGQKVCEGLSFLFQADFNASEGSPYTITFRASHPFSGEELFVNWTLFVRNVNRPPILRTSPPPGEINITSGEWLLFTASVEDPDGEEVEIIWLLNGSLIGRGRSFNFSQTTSGVYNLSVLATDGQDNTSLKWLIRVRPRPSPARLLQKSPNATLVVLNEGENVTFRVEISPGGWHPLAQRWLLNGEEVREGVEYTFFTAYIGPFSSATSPYSVTFRGEFKEGVLQVNWTVVVIDVNRDPVIENVTVEITDEWRERGFVVNLTFRGYDPDGDPLNVTWSADGEVILKEPYGRVVLSPGRHVIILNVTDGRGGWTLQVRVIEVPEKQNGGFLSSLPYVKIEGRNILTLVFILLIVIVLILVLLRRPPEGEEEYYE
ncbi:MAG: hypothetical protein DRN42_03885 [Thermoplasmata archaeon]|nr:MAG: hypothetical protein DRN42_03885 [Thermoplasmata archaeon]